MKRGYLSQYFEGVALKRLSSVEADVDASHQHEFNGVEILRKMLGDPQGKSRYTAKFLYLSDQDDEPILEDGFLTWYDARQKARLERGIMRWEYRLYFPTNLVSQCASEGDLLVIAKCRNNTLLAIIAEQSSTIERQLMWLFGFSDVAHPGFSVKSELETEQDRIGFAARVVLEQIGVAVEAEESNYLDQMLDKFGDSLPETHEFSAYARSTISSLSAKDDPDAALMAWMDREEILFRTLEKYHLGEGLQGLVDAEKVRSGSFIDLAESTLRRRRLRIESALQNHLEQIFSIYKIEYTRNDAKKGSLRPDFIFPGVTQYRDSSFPPVRLTMLSSLTSCKDCWKQLLSEASRIPEKHLVTIEPSISENQTSEMMNERVRMVVPRGLHYTYTPKQKKWLMSVREFVALVSARQ